MKTLIAFLMIGFSAAALAADPKLCTELTNDPLGRGYSGMTPAQKSADLNTKYRTRWKAGCIQGTELLDAIDEADWVGITDNQRDRALLILSIGCLNPQGNARTMLKGIFGAGSQTVSNMAAVAQETVSRAEELGISDVRPGVIQECP